MKDELAVTIGSITRSRAKQIRDNFHRFVRKVLDNEDKREVESDIAFVNIIEVTSLDVTFSK